MRKENHTRDIVLISILTLFAIVVVDTALWGYLRNEKVVKWRYDKGPVYTAEIPRPLTGDGEGSQPETLPQEKSDPDSEYDIVMAPLEESYTRMILIVTDIALIGIGFFSILIFLGIKEGNTIKVAVSIVLLCAVVAGSGFGIYKLLDHYVFKGRTRDTMARQVSSRDNEI